MIRFILKRRFEDAHINMGVVETFLTLDADVPELQRQLTSGGFGNAGFECFVLVGAEILPEPAGMVQKESNNG